MTTIKPSVFPYVTFINVDGTEYTIPRDNVLHVETFHYMETGEKILDDTKVFVNFVNPNPKVKTNLYAVVDMPLLVFRDQVMRPAYEGSTVPVG